MPVAFRCVGCGASLGESGRPFACPASLPGDDIDHVVVAEGPGDAGVPAGEGGPNPFGRYGGHLSAHALARSRGMSDAAFLDVVAALDRAIAVVDGKGFVRTPFEAQEALAARLGLALAGSVWVKDETRNVSGSHKARHLAGIMLYLLVAERTGLLGDRSPLAIASCGNAALAAAVVARAARWPLDVFVPPTAAPTVLRRLSGLGASVSICRRQAGRAGDPCYLAFRRALERGAIPFCCQGSDNGMTIEGGALLAREIAEEPGGRSLDAVFVQVGGGALASAVAQGFDQLRREGTIERAPRLYAVQTAGGYPLVRAYDRLVARMISTWPDEDEPPSGSPDELAATIAGRPRVIDEALDFARGHRSQFMWPWEEEPQSVAHGILDDETYDWAAVVEAMLRTGGRPVIVGESRLREANDLGREATGIDVDHTGSAGLAGLIETLGSEPRLRRSRLALLFTGRPRKCD